MLWLNYPPASDELNLPCRLYHVFVVSGSVGLQLLRRKVEEYTIIYYTLYIINFFLSPIKQSWCRYLFTSFCIPFWGVLTTVQNLSRISDSVNVMSDGRWSNDLIVVFTFTTINVALKNDRAECKNPNYAHIFCQLFTVLTMIRPWSEVPPYQRSLLWSVFRLVV